MDVLFVDDERPVLEQAKLFLEDLKDDLKVETSSSARDAMDKIKMKRYDAVVSDYLMPEMDGLDFLERLRGEGEDIPFVVLTGRGGEDIAMEALNEGADFYLTKKGDPKYQYEVLADSIERVINRKKARKELEDKFELLLNNSPEGIIINDEFGNNLYVNNCLLDILDYSEEDIFMMNMTDIDLILSVENKKSYYWNRMKTGELNFIYTTYNKNDLTDIDVRVKTKKIVDEGKTYIINFVERLEETRGREKFKKFFDKVPDLGFIIDEDGTLEDINPSFCRLTGYSKVELLGRRITSLKEILTDDNIDKIKENLTKFKEINEIEPFVIKLKDKENKDMFVRIEGDVIDINGRNKLFGMACDITDRVESENREEFLHSLLSHDIKNKAQVIKGYLDLTRQTGLTEEQEKMISKAYKTLITCVGLVKKVDTLMKIPDIEKEKIRLKPLVDSIVSEFEHEAEEEDMDIIYELDDIHVLGGSLLEEVLSNILINSITHSNGSKVEIRSEELNGNIKIIVEDDGKGISDDLKKIIFERNSRKGKFAGTGLGMFIAKKIVESMDGEIEVKDSKYGGARFDIYLNKT
ncbi:MAG: PAS domain S-box protein [Thermoplasmatota archaeon]